jgi:hypothetical protein
MKTRVLMDFFSVTVRNNARNYKLVSSRKGYQVLDIDDNPIHNNYWASAETALDYLNWIWAIPTARMI